MTTPPLRVAARVIALDDDQRVLLLRYEKGGFWATPGGALNKGEDHITALLRELREELGVYDAAVDLGEQVAERSQDHKVSATAMSARSSATTARTSPPATSTRPAPLSPTASAAAAGGRSMNCAPPATSSTHSAWATSSTASSLSASPSGPSSCEQLQAPAV
jgi:ADP-ribose pyrophosphatase YjhB (NUDIX family)